MKLYSCAMAVAFAISAGPILAEEWSDQELIQRLNAQREQLEAAELGQSRGLGESRGFEFATTESASVEGEEDSVDFDDPETIEEQISVVEAPSVQEELSVVGIEEPRSDGLEPLADLRSEPNEEQVATDTVPPPPSEQVNPRLATQTLELPRFDETIEINISINFAFDSAVIEDSEQLKLAQMCRVMTQSAVNVFRIIGHTDTKGSDEYNKRLSALRAEEVKRYLVNDCGLNPDRVEAIGVGEQFPLEGTEGTDDANRRVEFQAA